jgi:hypothetical protein
MGREETSQRLASLIKALGWTQVEDREAPNPESQQGPAELDADEKEMTKAVVEEVKGVTILSHSKYVLASPSLYPLSDWISLSGSYVHAWMLKEYPHLVKRSCFVDPVTFCSWEGDVCYNFIYRAPMTVRPILLPSSGLKLTPVVLGNGANYEILRRRGIRRGKPSSAEL